MISAEPHLRSSARSRTRASPRSCASGRHSGSPSVSGLVSSLAELDRRLRAPPVVEVLRLPVGDVAVGLGRVQQPEQTGRLPSVEPTGHAPAMRFHPCGELSIQNRAVSVCLGVRAVESIEPIVFSSLKSAAYRRLSSGYGGSRSDLRDVVEHERRHLAPLRREGEIVIRVAGADEPVPPRLVGLLLVGEEERADVRSVAGAHSEIIFAAGPPISPCPAASPRRPARRRAPGSPPRRRWRWPPPR